MSVLVDVQYANALEAVPAPGQISRWVSAAVRDGSGAEVSVRIVDEVESAALNAAYRNKEAPTNVLAFPADVALENGVRLLGDIAVCAPLVLAQAREQGKRAEAHWAHLIVHGTLHLQGFNHENADDAARMEALEVDILAGLGYSNPYEAGDPAASG